MWSQLALAAAKSLQDQQNRQNNIASNVITQKYSPWTGAQADFSAIGKNNTIGNLIAGYGSGLLQDKEDAKDAAEKSAEEDAEKNKKLNEMRGWQAQYEALQKKKASAMAQQAAPAVSVGPSRAPSSSFDNAPSFASVMQPQYQDPTPLMLQANPGQENRWLSMMQLPMIQGTKESVKQNPFSSAMAWNRR